MAQKHPIDNLRLRGITDRVLQGPEGWVYTYADGTAIGMFDITELREELPEATRERDLEAIRRAVVDRLASEFDIDVSRFRYLERDRNFSMAWRERTYQRNEDKEVVPSRGQGEPMEQTHTEPEAKALRQAHLRREASFVLGPDWHTGLRLPGREGYVERAEGVALVEISFRGAGEPRAYERTITNAQTGRTESRQVLAATRAFGATADSPPAVIVISDQPENQVGELLAVSPRIAHRLQEEFGLGGFPSTTQFYLHYPENVHGGNQEVFHRVEFGYDPTPPDKEPRPYLHHSSREPGAIKAWDTVAALLGEEAMRQHYPLSKPGLGPSLSRRALEAGLDPALQGEPNYDLA